MRLRDVLGTCGRVVGFVVVYYSGLAYNVAFLLPLVVATPAAISAIVRRRAEVTATRYLQGSGS